MDRWNIVACLNYLSPEHEIAVLQKKTKQSNIDVATIKMMVKMANTTRESFKNGDLSTLISLRTLISWGKNIAIFGSVKQAFVFSFYNKIIDDEKPLIAEFYQRIFADEI
jgi:cobaltochelatase CobS